MTQFVDDLSVLDFVDDLGIVLWVDDNGTFLGSNGVPDVIVPPVLSTEETDTSDGHPKRKKPRKGRFANADDELTEFEVQFMQRKLRELKEAKTEREKVAHAKTLEVALAQATKDDDAAEVITATIQKAGKSDYGAVMRDMALLTEITNQLQGIAKQFDSLQDEQDVEELSMAVL